MPPALRVHHGRSSIAAYAATLALLLCILGGCAVAWVSPYDKDSVERTTAISKNILAYYQQLFSSDPGKRAALVSGPLAAKSDEIETQLRVHLLLEQARPQNSETVTIVGNLLQSWEQFGESHRSSDPTALSTATLKVERLTLERHLRSALTAEEAKKTADGAAK